MNTHTHNDRATSCLNQAISLHQQGRLKDAEIMYQQVLSVETDNFLALDGIGTVYGQMGRYEEALHSFSKAIRVHPNDFAVHFNHGLVLRELKRHIEAISSFNAAISLNPNFAEAYNNRGIVLKELHRYEESLDSYEKAISLKPSYANAYNNKGAILLEQFKRYGEAIDSFNMAIALRPDFAEAYFNRGKLLSETGRFQEALASYNQAISINPNYAEAYFSRGMLLLDELKSHGNALISFDKAIECKHNFAEAYFNRGRLLSEIKQYQKALASYDQAISIIPNYVEAYNNKGIILAGQYERYQEALACFNKAIEFQPDCEDALYNRAKLLCEINDINGALENCNQIILINPNHVDANFNKGLLKLKLGEYEEGWLLNEWRWQTGQCKNQRRAFSQPLWLGNEPPRGRLLLHAEQGFGDTIQFIRYVPWVEEMGARVILEIPRTLVSLIGTLKAKFQMVVKGEDLPKFDLHCPLMSLPLALKTTLTTIPADIPYLFADPRKQETWHKRLGSTLRPKVGLAWSGSPHHPNDRNRSISLQSLRPLLELDCEYHVLQKEIRLEDKLLMNQLPQLHVHEDELRDFSDAAALISMMDVIITVDTAIAHLAGALGKPVWVLLPFVSDFRWLLDREDSPWYPSARLFRQPNAGDWPKVIELVRNELKSRLER